MKTIDVKSANGKNIDVKNKIAELHSTAESWSPQQVLAWAFETFGNRVAISSAFGAEPANLPTWSVTARTNLAAEALPALRRTALKRSSV